MTQSSSKPSLFSRARLKAVSEHQLIPALPRDGAPLPASAAQQMFWYLSKIEKAGQAYVLQAALHLHGPLDARLLQQALIHLAERHEGLRARFDMQGAQLKVSLSTAQESFPLHLEQTPLSLCLRAKGDQSWDMEPQTGPLACAHLFPTDEGGHHLLLRLHHLVADHTSLGLIVEELARIYSALCKGHELPDLGPALAFADYAAWEAETRKKDLVAAADHWQELLKDCPALSTPAAKVITRNRTADTLSGAAHRFEIPDDVLAQLKAFSHELSLSPFTTALTAWMHFLHLSCGQNDVVTAVPASLRGSSLQMERTVGPLLNTLPIRSRVSPQLRADSAALQLQAQFDAASQHRRMPITEIVERLAPARSSSHNPLYQTLFSWNRSGEQKPLRFGAAEGRAIELPRNTSQLDLTLDIVETPCGIEAEFEYDTSLFKEEQIIDFANDYLSILSQITQTKEGEFAQLSLLQHTPPSISTGAALPKSPQGLVLDMFAAQAASHPQAIAISDCEVQISYCTLERRANAMARAILERGIKPGGVIAIRLPRSAEAIIALIAVLKAGCTFVPLDPDAPSKRNDAILADCGAGLLITQDPGQTSLPHLQPLRDERAIAPVVAGSQNTSDPLAYILYTSGSTGAPKGVLVHQQALADMVRIWGQELCLGPENSFLQMANFNFDVAIADVLRALCFGGALVLCPKETLSDPRALSDLIRRQEVNSGDFVPAVLDALTASETLAKEALSGFRLLLCGSDRWPLENAQRLLKLLPPNCRALHAYGLTETIVDALYFDLRRLAPDARTLPLGQALPGGSVTLVDQERQPVPLGQEGEICISGPCLAQGYLKASAQEQGRFTRLANGQPALMTGDLGVMTAKGEILFQGRADSQISLRGYRIEPGDIESRLVAHGAGQATVCLKEGQLVAYVTGIRAEGLRPLLLQELAPHMVPQAIVELDQLPLTANGKIDHNNLPAPERNSEFELPLGPIEAAIAQVWQDLLQTPAIGRNDNFFELGGHSMLAVRMGLELARILERDIDSSLVFAHPTLAGFAHHCGETQLQAPALKRRKQVRQVPASFGQEALWLLAQNGGQNGAQSAAYNMPFALRLPEDCNLTALQKALNDLVSRHEALRCAFIAEAGKPHLVIEEPGRVLPLRRVNLTETPLEVLAQLEATTPFDLAQAPLARAVLGLGDSGAELLFFTLHHSIADGWSIDILARELEQLYLDYAAGRPVSLQAVALQYSDFTLWQREALDAAQLENQLEFWQQKLAAAPELLPLPTDKPRPAVQDFTGAQLPVSISGALLTELRTLAREEGTTVFTLVLAAWQNLLAQLSGESDIVTGVPLANRRQAGSEGIVGFFVNTVAIRFDQEKTATPRALIQAMMSEMAAAQGHQDVPFAQVIERLNPARSPAHGPVFQNMLAWESGHGGKASDIGEQRRSFEPVETQLAHAKYDLLLELSESGTAIEGTLQFATALFEEYSAARFLQFFEHLLRVFVETPDKPLAQIGLLPQETCRAEQQRWIAPARPLLPAETVQAQFAGAARRWPDAEAVTGPGQSLSYRQLDRLSDALAGILLARGLKPEQPVALWADRSAETITAIAAILKAGGAVLPLDPAQPEQRLAYILSEAAPLAVLARDPEGPSGKGIAPASILSIAHAELQNLAPPVSLPDISCDQAAYVLFTSGTTGRPKGVVQTHRMLQNLCAHQLALAPNPGRVLQFAALGFDVSFQEIIPALCGGSTLVLLSQEQSQDAAALAKILSDQRITRAFLPVAVLPILADGLLTLEEDLDCDLFAAGEALKLDDKTRKALRRLGQGSLYNHYGPTETHVVSEHRLPATGAQTWPDSPPIGRALPNTRLYVLDKQQNPVPDGVPGELYAAGAPVAKGYLNQPDLTAERFMPDPFADTKEARMFRTGDLVRRTATGDLLFLGRADDQVKIRGFRVEPGEVETSLTQHPAVDLCAVLPRRAPAGDLRLVAYWSGNASETELKRHAADWLPAYMRPAHYLHLPLMPLNSSGKIHRQQLPLPDWGQASESHHPCTTQAEQRLATIWKRVLKLEEVSARADFFALGGHSLLAAQLAHEITAGFDRTIRLHDIFAHPVLAEMALLLEDEGSELPKANSLPQIKAAPEAAHDPFPLSDLQQAYLVGRGDSMELGGVSAHSYNELRIRDLDIPRFEAALNQVILRHGMLRAVFTKDGQQQVLPDPGAYRIAVHDLSRASAEAQESGLQAVRARMSHQVLDAGTWPLFAFEATVLPGGITHLHLSLDALIVDAASTSILMQELLTFYFDPAKALPQPQVSFRDYILAEQALRGDNAYQADLAYWLERFETLPAGPDLPLARRPDQLSAPAFTRREKRIPAEAWDRIKQNAAQQQITPSALLLACFCAVLQRHCNSQGFCLSLPLFNRLPLHPDINAVIGDFTSVLLFQSDLDLDAPFTGIARKIQRSLWQDMDRARVSGIEVLRVLGRKLGQTPEGLPVVFNSTLTEMTGTQSASEHPKRLDAENVHTITQTPQVWLDHTILEEDGALHFNWDSIDALFPEGLVDGMFREYCGLLDGLAEASAWARSPVSAALAPQPLPPLPALPRLHGAVLAQAGRTPDHLAVISPARSLDYRTLATEAQAVAARLQATGCRPGDLVAVFMAPGWEQSVAVLGILMAGGAYVPLDRDLPPARLTHLIARTGIKHILVEAGFAAQDLLPAGLQVQKVIAGAQPPVGDKAWRPVEREGRDLAYVIFTSGSTGEPKGVMISHDGAANTIADINQRMQVTTGDRVLAVSALNFDLSVYDIFGPLSLGAALVLPEAAASRDPSHWIDLIQQQGVTLWNSVPALMGLLAEQAEARGVKLPLRQIMMSGDWIPLDLPARIAKIAPEASQWSLGGATEASIWSIAHPITRPNTGPEPGWDSIPYGKALQGQSFYVLDDAMNIRPDWVTGELYIGGHGLALGYWADEVRTNAAFVTHPVTGARLYRTGDMGRTRPGGVIEFQGRRDTQVKVQGHRIELGSIETTLERHPGVKSAALRVWGEAMQARRLAGYVVPQDPRLGEAELRSYLAEQLAAYEIPATLTFLQELPLSANGKVDRKQLPQPNQAEAAKGDQERYSEIELKLIEIAKTALDQPDLQPEQNLLALGANSLDIVRLCNALAAETGFRPPLAELMRDPRAATLIAIYRRDQEERLEPLGKETPEPQGTLDKDLALIESEAERRAFKAAQKGRRILPQTAPRQVLSRSAEPGIDRYEANRSVREYRDQPVPQESFAALLSCLGQNASPDRPRFQFASAGGLYPVQTYCYVKPGKVTGLVAGCYYFDPLDHCLVAVGSGAELSSDAYDYFVNRPTFEAAGFALFLVADWAAIQPLYGAASRDMALIETGQIAQHLTNRAGELGLGLCGIGSLEGESISALLGLGRHHSVLYSMLGGIPDHNVPDNTDEFEEFEI